MGQGGCRRLSFGHGQVVEDMGHGRARLECVGFGKETQEVGGGDAGSDTGQVRAGLGSEQLRVFGGGMARGTTEFCQQDGTGEGVRQGWFPGEPGDEGSSGRRGGGGKDPTEEQCQMSFHGVFRSIPYHPPWGKPPPMEGTEAARS